MTASRTLSPPTMVADRNFKLHDDHDDRDRIEHPDDGTSATTIATSADSAYADSA